MPVFLISLRPAAWASTSPPPIQSSHYDPWWNPAVENQATDRAHRPGKKAVFVPKLVVAGSIERRSSTTPGKRPNSPQASYPRIIRSWSSWRRRHPCPARFALPEATGDSA